MRSDQLGHQGLGQQAYGVDVVVRIANGRRRPGEVPADGDDAGLARPGPLEDSLVPGRSGEHQQGVVGVLGQVDADVSPDAGLAALDGCLTARGSTAGPSFTSMQPEVATLEPISGNAATRIVKDRARFAGLGAERITAHSLRAGHATNAALAGVSVDRIAAQTRHRRIDVFLERYSRPAQARVRRTSRSTRIPDLQPPP